MKLSTVNVTEYYNGTINGVHAYTDDDAGNREAEAQFISIAKGFGMSEEDTDDALEEGLYENGDYQVFLTHSEPE
jgi:hypothetical protein